MDKDVLFLYVLCDSSYPIVVVMKYSNCKVINKLVVEKIKSGWDYEPKGGKKHSKIVAPNGRKMPIPSSPSCGRAANNFKCQLKRLALI